MVDLFEAISLDEADDMVGMQPLDMPTAVLNGVSEGVASPNPML